MPVSSQGFSCHWLPSFCPADLGGKLKNCSTNVLVNLQAITKRPPNTMAWMCSNVISLLLLIHRGHKTVRGRKLVSSNPLWDPTFLHPALLQDQLRAQLPWRPQVLLIHRDHMRSAPLSGHSVLTGLTVRDTFAGKKVVTPPPGWSSFRSRTMTFVSPSPPGLGEVPHMVPGTW